MIFEPRVLLSVCLDHPKTQNNRIQETKMCVCMSIISLDVAFGIELLGFCKTARRTACVLEKFLLVVLQCASFRLEFGLCAADKNSKYLSYVELVIDVSQGCICTTTRAYG